MRIRFLEPVADWARGEVVAFPEKDAALIERRFIRTGYAVVVGAQVAETAMQPDPQVLASRLNRRERRG